MKNLPVFLFTVLSFLLIASCTKDSDFATAGADEYFPMQAGKFIRYRLDSMRFVEFGQRDTIISYDAKDVVDAEISDNTGRKSFRVVRYLRDINSSSESDYAPTLTYMVTPGTDGVEVVENNLRFIKLKLPVREGFSWHGNSFLPSSPFYSIYQFSNDEDIDQWNYTYSGVNESITINDHVYDSTVTVLQVADSANVPIEFPDGIAYRNYWTETYAKNVGLISREVVMWEYQPPASGNLGFRSGFGLKMTIVEHN